MSYVADAFAYGVLSHCFFLIRMHRPRRFALFHKLKYVKCYSTKTFLQPMGISNF